MGPLDFLIPICIRDSRTDIFVQILISLYKFVSLYCDYYSFFILCTIK
jgi:hypothetical protein